jgi:hypothetical protein
VDSDTFYAYDTTWDITLRVENMRNSDLVKVTNIATDIGSYRSCWDVAYRMANGEFRTINQLDATMRDKRYQQRRASS